MTVIDETTWRLLERLTDKQIPPRDWPKVRQCLRLLVNSEEIAPLPGRKVKQIVPSPRGVKTVMEACLAVADSSKTNPNVTLLEAALLLVTRG